MTCEVNEGETEKNFHFYVFWYLNFPDERANLARILVQNHSLLRAKRRFTFDGYLAISPGANGVVCPTNVRSFLWNIADCKIRLLVTIFALDTATSVSLVFRIKIPLVLVIIGIAVGHTNQRILAVFILSLDGAVGSVWYKLIKNRRNYSSITNIHGALFICSSFPWPLDSALFRWKMPPIDSNKKKGKRILGRCLKTIMGTAARERTSEWTNDVMWRRKGKNSHKIFIVMLATLLPCLFSTMHEYTPLSVRFSPRGNVKVGVVISTSSVSNRFQWYFGAVRVYRQKNRA